MTFSYRRGFPIVDRLSWAVPPGVTVLLGPNGAGKSTTLSLAASVLRPRSGSVAHGGLHLDRRADRDEWRRRVGWVPQHVAAVPGFSVFDQVTYAGWLKKLPTSTARRSAARALEVTGLTKQASQMVTTVSGGQLRRVGIACALVHDADTLILDEPTAGLDPSQKSRIRQYLTDLRGGRDVIISTHQVDDLELVADNVAVMGAGQILFCGPTGQFLDLGRLTTSSSGEDGASVGHLAELAYARLTEVEL